MNHAGKDLGDLLRALPCRIDHFRHAGANRAMVVDLGEADVFEGERAQTVHGVVGGDGAGLYFVE